MVVYEDCKVFGPYIAKQDDRMRVVIEYPDKSKRTVSYPKYLMELGLGRYLDDNETVHHKDEDPQNNAFSNLEILPRQEHAANDVLRKEGQSFVCPWCDVSFVISGEKLHDTICNRKKGKAGPFCGRSCAGKYSKSLQMGGDALDVIQIHANLIKRSESQNEPVIGNSNSGGS